MKTNADLDALSLLFGVLPTYRDLDGNERKTSAETKLALLRANGLELDTPKSIQEALNESREKIKRRALPEEKIIPSDQSLRIEVPAPVQWELELDDGRLMEGKAEDAINLPGLPAGLHNLTLNRNAIAEKVLLVSAPAQAPSVRKVTGNPKIWGVNTMLYGLHSSKTRSLGTYDDLALAAELMATKGAGFFGINPIHAMGWSETEIFSPYSPSHRAFLDTRYIATHRLPGIPGNVPELNETLPLTLDYQHHRSVHNVELEQAFLHFLAHADVTQNAEFCAYCENDGEPLQRFALFETISERFGPNWRAWPAEWQNCDSPVVRQFGEHHTERIRFHCWLQWIANLQMEEAQSRAFSAGMAAGLYLDLAVGPRRGGAETWCEQSCVAKGVSIGAPPDHLSPAGQNWDLAGFAPDLLRQTDYTSFRNTLRRVLRHAGILRIDHVLGLNRSFWIPDDGSPGGYIQQPFETLLAIIAIEAQAAGALIIGEDLGLVPPNFREDLRKRNVYSYSVLQYERTKNGRLRPPTQLRPESIASFGTHDTPTLRGYLDQIDIDWWRKLDWIDADQEKTAREARKEDIQALLSLAQGKKTQSDLGPFETLNETVHAALSNSPAAMVSVQLDDVLGEPQPQNIPGTISEHPNWQRRYSQPIESVANSNSMDAIATHMRKSGRSGGKGSA